MTTELVLLLAAMILVVFSFVTSTVRTFLDSGPRLAARLEKNITIGHRFRPNGEAPISWEKPSGGNSQEEGW